MQIASAESGKQGDARDEIAAHFVASLCWPAATLFDAKA
jgi:hypothetical protein